MYEQSPLSQFNEAIFKSPLEVSHVKRHVFMNPFRTLMTEELRVLDTLGRFFCHLFTSRTFFGFMFTFRTQCPF